MTKGSVHQEQVTVVNTPTLASLKQLPAHLKGELDSDTVTRASLLHFRHWRDRPERKGIREQQTQITLQSRWTQQTYTEHSTQSIRTVFTSAQGACSRTDHVLDHKARLHKTKSTEIT